MTFSDTTRENFGNGDISFAVLLQLLESKKPKSLELFEQDALQLWNSYAAFGTELANFRRRFEESQSIYPTSGHA